MKKFNKIVSLILALVLVIGASAMPAMAANCAACNDGKDYTWTYNSDGTVKLASWRHVCSKGPAIFGAEDKRDAVITQVQKGNYTVAYYMDANGDLWTDMPKYGGTLIAENGTDEWNTALYNTTTAITWEARMRNMRPSNPSAAAADTTPVGFTDVPDGKWYSDAVNALAHTGIINGVGNNLFDPNSPITWKQMYWILERLLGVNGEYLPTATYYEGEQIIGIEEIVGAAMGWNDNSVPANDKTPVNRAEAISIVATLYSLRSGYFGGSNYVDSATGLKDGYWVNNAVAADAQKAVANGAKAWTVKDIPDGAKLVELAESYTDYTSRSTLTDYADASIYDSPFHSTNVIDIANILRAYTLGLVRGKDSNGTMDPTGTLTRAEFCQMLYNAGVFGCVYPAVDYYRCSGNLVVGNLNVSHLQAYLRNNRIDGTHV